MSENFLPPEGLSIPERLGRLATLGLLVQRLALDGTPEGKDFSFAVGSIISQESAEIRAFFEKHENEDVMLNRQEKEAC